MRSICLMVTAMLAGSCTAPMTTEPDAGMEVRSSCPPRVVTTAPDYYGEACTEAASPAVTICHPDDTGWCVSGECRPMCDNSCERCAVGRPHFTDRGACYCLPE